MVSLGGQRRYVYGPPKQDSTRLVLAAEEEEEEREESRFPGFLTGNYQRTNGVGGCET